MKKMTNNRALRNSGFSLVEMAIVLVIVGLLLGGLLTPLSMQMEQRKMSETQRQMDEIREALIGFALRNGYLPCPAISASDGLEDRDGDKCGDDKRQGYVPWATLGVGKLDSWGHLFHYSVTPAFTRTLAPFAMSTARDISVYTRSGAAGTLVGATAENDIPAVVMSYGKNGAHATSDQGVLIADPSSTNIDEKANAGGDGTRFVTRPPGDNARQPGGEFDDMVSWISPNILYNRMVAAQRLP
jgi:prepilin-type N-terminal cleavage/methylation domain-containing protein